MRYLMLSLFFITYACSEQTAKTKSGNGFSIEEVKPLIQSLGKTWGKALRSKDIARLQNLYDQNAHYLPDDDQAFHGNEAISAYWKASLDFVGDIQLNMETLDGTKEVLYETGNGIVKVMNNEGQFVDVPFKYVNVWKLQEDGSYKVVIDMFNDIKPDAVH